MKKIPTFQVVRQWRWLANLVAISIALQSISSPVNAGILSFCKGKLRDASHNVINRLPYHEEINKVTDRMLYSKLDYKEVNSYLNKFSADPQYTNQRFNAVRNGEVIIGISEIFAMAIYASSDPKVLENWNNLLPDQLLVKFRLLPGITDAETLRVVTRGDSLNSQKYKMLFPNIKWEKFSDPLVLDALFKSITDGFALASDFVDKDRDLSGILLIRMVKMSAYKTFVEKGKIIKAYGFGNWVLVTFIRKFIPLALIFAYEFKKRMNQAGAGSAFNGSSHKPENDDACKPNVENDDPDIEVFFDPGYDPKPNPDGVIVPFNYGNPLMSPELDVFIAPRQDKGHDKEPNPCDPDGYIARFFASRHAEFPPDMTKKTDAEQDRKYLEWVRKNSSPRDENGKIIGNPLPIDKLRGLIRNRYMDSNGACRNYYAWYKHYGCGPGL